MSFVPTSRPPRPRSTLPQARPTTPESSALADQIINSIGAAPPPAPRRFYYATSEDGKEVQTYSNQPLETVVKQLEKKAQGKIADVRHGRRGSRIPTDDLNRRAKERPSERHLLSICPQATSFNADTSAPLDPPPVTPSPPRAAWAPGLPPAARHAIRAASGPNNPPAWLSPHSGPHAATVPMEAVRLSDRVPTFLAYLGHRRSSRSVVIDSVWTYRIFMELVGDKALNEITVLDCDTFLHALSVWPAHASKRREFRNMHAHEVIAKAQRLHRAPLNPRTQQKHIDRLRALFYWLERRGEIVPGLLRGVRLFRRHEDLGQARVPFDDDQLTWMFEVHRKTPLKTPYQYWAPILGLYQGMRVNELGQLYIDDVLNVSGMWCIDVTRDRPGQRLKNKMSRRVLPIHPTVLKCGFLDFVDQARRWGRTTLFPDVIWGCNGPGDSISDWFNRTFLRKMCGIVHPTQTFHSFRHTFATIGDRSNVRHDRLASFLGHTAGHSTLTDHYIKLCGPRDLELALQEMQFPSIEHVPYQPSNFEHCFETAAKVEHQLSKLDAVYGPRKR